MSNTAQERIESKVREIEEKMEQLLEGIESLNQEELKLASKKDEYTKQLFALDGARSAYLNTLSLLETNEENDEQ